MGGVWPIQVVVLAPVLDQDLGFEERVEVPQVEQLVSHPSIERFDPRVLRGAARVVEHGIDMVEAVR